MSTTGAVDAWSDWKTSCKHCGKIRLGDMGVGLGGSDNLTFAEVHVARKLCR
ncbi:MAG: hypothetical protein ACREPL_13270 [Rhodanobacteraceae bacterium]